MCSLLFMVKQVLESFSLKTHDFWVIALRPQAPKHIRGGWSHYTDTSEPVDGNGAQNMVTVQSGFRTRDLSITGPTRLPPTLTRPRYMTVARVGGARGEGGGSGTVEP
jgi:hypothetical protein